MSGVLFGVGGGSVGFYCLRLLNFFPGLVFFEPLLTSGSISAMSFLGRAARRGDDDDDDSFSTVTPDGVTAPRDLDWLTVTFSKVVTLRDVRGADADGVGSGYGLAQSSSSTTAPGREPGVGVRSRGEVMGVASVISTVGGGGGGA